MPVAKGLPKRPKPTSYNNVVSYATALERYIDNLENWIDVRCFQDGDDNIEKKAKAQTSESKVDQDQLETTKKLFGLLCKMDEPGVKIAIANRWPHGVGLYE